MATKRALWAPTIQVFLIAELAFSQAKLAPAGAFTILDAVPSSYGAAGIQVHKFIAKPNDLYFLLSHGPSPSDCLVLKTDVYGAAKSSVLLGAGEVRDFEVDDNGTLYVLFGLPDDRLITYRADGSVVNSQPMPQATKISFMAGRGLQTVRFDGQELEGNSKPASSGLRFRGLENRASTPKRFMQIATRNHLIIVEGVSATLEIGDPATVSISTVTISTPEIEAAKSYYTASISDLNQRGVVIPSAVASRDYVYLMVGSYNQANGAPVVKVDSDGTVIDTFSCPLPGEPRRPGSLFPSHIGVNDKQLFLVSAGGTVAVYDLGGQ